jgi:hypothetical protein
MDDDELIAALAAGDETALCELFMRHASWLAARLRAALSPPDVEDVLQETFLAVWKGAGGYRPRGTPQVASVSGGQDVQSGISGNPPAFEFTAERVGIYFGQFLAIPDPVGWREGFQQGLLDAFLARPSQQAGSVHLGPAQQAVEDALLTAGGTNVSATIGQMLQNGQPIAGPPAVRSAAQRFAALSAGARHAWLAAHLAALRAGAITLAQIP